MVAIAMGANSRAAPCAYSITRLRTLSADRSTFARSKSISAPQFRSLGDEIYNIINLCLHKDPARRPDADAINARMEEICYSLDNYEIGVISKLHITTTGFIIAEKGGDLMFHRDNFYGDTRRNVGDRLWYARHSGIGNDRAFPIVRLLKKSP